MVKQYRSREGEATAVDTKTALTTLGSETAPGPLLVPTGVSMLVGVILAAAGQIAAATAATAFIRMEGGGLPEGPETLAAGAFGATVATGSQNLNVARYIGLGVKVTPGNEILLYGEMAGTDITQISFGVTLVFQ